MKQEKATRRKRLYRVAILLVFVIIVVVGVMQLYLNNALTGALIRSLDTFQIEGEVTYPSVQPNSVEMNITFKVENPTGFSITIDEIIISFLVEDVDIGGMTVDPVQEVPPNETTYFYFVRVVTQGNVLGSLQGQSYRLSVEGKIRGSARFLFVNTGKEKDMAFSQTMTGIP